MRSETGVCIVIGITQVVALFCSRIAMGKAFPTFKGRESAKRSKETRRRFSKTLYSVCVTSTACTAMRRLLARASARAAAPSWPALCPRLVPGAHSPPASLPRHTPPRLMIRLPNTDAAAARPAVEIWAACLESKAVEIMAALYGGERVVAVVQTPRYPRPSRPGMRRGTDRSRGPGCASLVA